MGNTLDQLPRDHELVSWKLLGQADSTVLHGLIRELEERDHALFRTSTFEVEEMLDRPSIAYVVGGYAPIQGDTGAASKLVAFGYVGLARSGKPEAICHGGVLPEYRLQGIGECLLSWQTRVGTQLVGDSFGADGGHISHAVDARRSSFHSHLESIGYEWTHSFAELRLDLEGPTKATDLPTYFEIVPWTSQWEESARKAYNRASKLAGQETSQSALQWTEARAHLSPELSFLAIDRSGDRAKVAGLVEVGIYEDDWHALGWKEGYIDTVAVFDSSLRGVLLGGLLTAALNAMTSGGLDKAAVGLDPGADPDMMSFYEGVGFAPHAWWRHYARPVKPSRKLSAD